MAKLWGILTTKLWMSICRYSFLRCYGFRIWTLKPTRITVDKCQLVKYSWVCFLIAKVSEIMTTNEWMPMCGYSFGHVVDLRIRTLKPTRYNFDALFKHFFLRVSSYQW